MARAVAVVPALVVLLAASGCWRLATTARSVHSTLVGLPIEECEGLAPLDIEHSALISFDWGDGSPVDHGNYDVDAPRAVCQSHTYSSPGVYEGSVSVSPGQGGFDTRPMTVNVGEADPSYLAVSGTCTCHTTAVLSADLLVGLMSATDIAPPTFTWAFGDGTTAVTTQSQVHHAYPAAGSYTATVTVNRPYAVLPSMTTSYPSVAWAASTVTVGG